jgi:4-amino-4-deoxy-L-arabinose transferase-like glycosyltransferase
MGNRNQVLALVALWGIIYLVNCGHPPALLDDADTVHAEAAREMAESGNWITLHANGIRYLEKAPLMYWSIALSYKLLGVNEFASRLPIAVATLGLMFATMLIGNYFIGGSAGFYSGIVDWILHRYFPFYSCPLAGCDPDFVYHTGFLLLSSSK